MPRLFERFYRVENTRSRTEEGTGIGLALVHELVKLHGGSVRAESAVGQGSTFTVSVPFGKAHLAQDQIAAGRTVVSTALGPQPFVEEAPLWLQVVIGLSVNASPDNKDAMRTAGAAILLTKEAAVDELHSAIHEAIKVAIPSVSAAKPSP